MGDDCSRDFLQRFVAESKHQLMERSEESGEIELNLGLSLGVESKPTRLVRSQSTFKTENQDTIVYPLIRTTSLPMDSEEYRKRKELQCFKRKERTKKLMKRGGSREEQGVNALADAPRGFRPPSSQGSVGSPGTGSSGICELESRSVQGLGFNDTRTFAGVGSVAEQHGIASPMSTSNSRATISVKAEVTGMEGTKEMPCVSTKRIGPNGRRMQGFLYKYKRGLQEVKIVCVCHGRFLSPAEFVKHAGGGDVQYPLREIVVDSLSS